MAKKFIVFFFFFFKYWWVKSIETRTTIQEVKKESAKDASTQQTNLPKIKTEPATNEAATVQQHTRYTIFVFKDSSGHSHSLIRTKKPVHNSFFFFFDE